MSAQAELDILKERGLSPVPPQGSPAPPEATAARKQYQTVAEEFDQLFLKIQTYRGQASSADLGFTVQQLIDQAVQIAVEIRKRAAALGAWPSIFFRLDTGAVFFGEIARTAEEGYQRRLSRLTELETMLGSAYPSSRIMHGTLLSHEGFKGGHLLSMHVAWTMEDFMGRFLDEGKQILSAFIDRETAEDVVSRAIEINRLRIDQARDGDKIYIPIREGRDIGYVKRRGLRPYMTKSGHIVIFKDVTHQSGYRILTVELDAEEHS